LHYSVDLNKLNDDDDDDDEETEVNVAGKRRLRGDLIEALMIITGGEKVDKHKFFEISNNTHNLRRH